MAPPKVQPETRACPVCSSSFEVGGRGRRPRKAIYCSIRCANLARPPMAHPGSHAPRPKKNKDTLHNEVWLRAKYLDERLPSGAIALSLACSHVAVLWALRKFGIPVRTNSEAHEGLTSTAEWTPEMRETLAVKRRGTANPMHGRKNVRNDPNWHPDSRVRAIRKRRLHKYGLPGLAYEAMAEAQAWLCLTCGRPERKKRADGTMFTLSVDHDHATGKIRGLLCNACNSALGMVGDSVPILRAMVTYLVAHESSPVD